MARPEVSVLPDTVFVADRESPVPLYHELAEKIEAAILAGEVRPGGRIEDETSLSERLGVSRPTLRRAIQELVDKGLLVRRRGIGTQVVPPGSVARKLELTSLWEDLARMGKAPSTKVIAFERIAASEVIADRLGIAADAEVQHFRRVRYADSVPLAILENFVPTAVAELTFDELSERGLYQTLGRRGVTIRVAHQSITARSASIEDAGLLDLAKGDPLLVMTRTAFDASGRATETGTHCYRPDLYSFEATLVRS